MTTGQGRRRRGAATWLRTGLLAPVLLACSEPATEAPTDPCAPVFWVRPAATAKQVELIGSWNDWTTPGIPLARAGTSGYAGARLPVPAGEHGYLVVEDGVPRIDEDNALTTFRGDTEVSLLDVPACGATSLVVVDRTVTNDGAVTVRAELRDARSGVPVMAVSGSAEARDQGSPTVQTAGPILTMSILDLPRGRHTFTLRAEDARGAVTDRRISVWVLPRAKTWEDATVYQVMVDRFRGDDGTYLPPPKSAGDRAGGTLSGVRRALEDGSLDALGVSALWLSPLYANPTEHRTDRAGHLVTGYHGYWPIDSAAVEPRFGGEEALRDVVRVAHEKGIRVVLDVVPNHVFETHPAYVANKHNGWFHQSSSCVCGSAECPWSSHLEDCWFTPYLPDFRFENAEVSRRAAEDVTRWLTAYDLDGVRIDAVPMMKRSVTRRIVRDIRRYVGERDEALVLGEVFTGPGPDGIDAIRPFLGPTALDSAFDFPGMWSLRQAFAGGGSLVSVESILAASDASYEGSGIVPARIIGNHDVSRFLSEAAGNGSGDPWTTPPPQPTETEPYARHRLALAFLLTMPGMPILYYGDELALAGAGDPDCRRPLPRDSELSLEQSKTLALSRKLGTLRACSGALRGATRVPLLVSAEALVYARPSAEGDAVVVFPTVTGELGVAGVSGDFRDAVAGGAVSLPGRVTVRAGEVRVLLRVGDGCLAE